jgi:hypothetical protein
MDPGCVNPLKSYEGSLHRHKRLGILLRRQRGNGSSGRALLGGTGHRLCCICIPFGGSSGGNEGIDLPPILIQQSLGSAGIVYHFGSERESESPRILGRFADDEEFSLQGG